MSPERQVTGARSGQTGVMPPAQHPAHGAPRRPTVSWPAALLAGALLVTLMATAAGSTPSGSRLPVTELHVVDAPAASR
jgi:hypothetical protein